MLYDDNTAAQTFELYGPKQYSTAQIAELVDREIFSRRRHINVPRQLLEPAAKLLNQVLWWPWMSAEQIQMEHVDQVIDEKAKTFKDLGIDPGDISKFTYHYVVSPLHLVAQASRVVRCILIPITARLPQRRVLRPAASEREGEERGEKVPSCA
jgi:hypothetical protein